MKITIDGKVIEAEAHQTILDVCKNIGIEIPTLCFLPELEPYGSCLLCLVEIENFPRLVPSCGTKVSGGMVIHTNTTRVYKARKLCLELLLSAHWGDCLSPCTISCPAHIDIEGYVKFARNGDYEAAYNLIMENLPFPSSVGRICPAFCEENCRRQLKEGALAIRELKRFVGDWAIESGVWSLESRVRSQESRVNNGKKVAVVGGGPAGLSCAYYLAKEGYSVVVFEGEDKLGGMMRYGIPEYRLPKDILDKEIERIIGLGIEIQTNTKIGKNELIKLKMDFEAIFIGIGAQEGIKMGIEGEEACNVISGIKLLKDTADGKRQDLGKNVCIIGGGNTAIDCARTSLRLGVDEVSILYRRSRDEMPASKKEIEEAEAEGVKIEFLVAPSMVLSDGISCIRMELGEQDSKGRRKPIPIPGSEFKIKTDTIITAIGQRVEDNGLLDDKGLFSGGDCVSGPATVVEAIASGKKAAISIMNYLRSQESGVGSQESGVGSQESGVRSRESEYKYNCVREGITKEDLMETEEMPRYKNLAKGKNLVTRKAHNKTKHKKYNGFEEIEDTMDEKSAKKETERCLECGCEKVLDCALRKYATIYDVESERVSSFQNISCGARNQNISCGARNIEKKPVDTSRNDIKYDPNKCILCSKCLRVCYKIKKLGILGFVGRGYATQIKPSFGMPLSETLCDGCLECAKTCPTGAFVERKAVL